MRLPATHLTLPTLLVALALGSTAFADVKIGDTLSPFQLKDAISGKDIDLAKAKGDKATALLFISTQCPVSNAYNERMAALARDYTAKGVAIVGLNANRQESATEIAEHAKKHGLGFPVLKDEGNVEADAFGAHVTPEVYVYDPGWKLRYHGRIDDDRSGEKVTSQDLRKALDAVIGGKEVPVPETKAFGCSIKRIVRDAPPEAAKK